MALHSSKHNSSSLSSPPSLPLPFTYRVKAVVTKLPAPPLLLMMPPFPLLLLLLLLPLLLLPRLLPEAGTSAVVVSAVPTVVPPSCGIGSPKEQQQNRAGEERSEGEGAVPQAR